MTDAYLAINTLGFATGTVLFVWLIALARKAERLAGEPCYGTAAAVLGWLWNAGNLVKCAMLLLGLRYSLPYQLADVLAWSATGLLPTAFLLLLRPARWARPWQPRLGRWVFRLSYLNATGLTLGFFATAFVPDFPLRPATVERYSAYNLALHAAMGVILFRRTAPMTPALRSYSRTMLLLLVGLASSLLLLIHMALHPSLEMTLGILAQQSSLPMAMATFTFLARFRFADVFVKRSLTVLVAVIVASLHALLIVEPLRRWLQAAAPYPEESAGIATTMLWCALLLVFPRLERMVNHGADRWLFRRPDYQRLAHTMAQEMESLDHEQALFALVEQQIQSALDVATARVMPRAEVPRLGSEMDLHGSDAVQLRPDHPARNLLGQPEVDVLVPVQMKAAIVYFLAIAPGASGRKLLSDELTFLVTVAERIGRRLESLQFERERRERQLREARLQHLLTEAELKALLAQVNPHFLFNTLNTIMALIGSEPEKAEAMTERLAEVFRYVLARTERHLIPLSEEFEFLRTYLEIEQARFGDRLRVEMAIDPAIAAEPVPSLILQPLVENAIKHGLAPKLRGGRLRIRAVDEQRFVRLLVEDDGVGRREAQAPGQPLGGQSGIGLRNVTERLRTLYGDQAEMTIHSEVGQGTRVSLLIPKHEAQNIDHRRRNVGAVSAAETAERAS